jgi:hypothetical protein
MDHSPCSLVIGDQGASGGEENVDIHPELDQLANLHQSPSAADRGLEQVENSQ